MNTEQIMRLEKLLNRELAAEEIERLRRIQDTLRISAEDALWDILVAMEYQRVYYEELPEKISQTAAEIFSGLSHAVDNEISLTQSRLAESVVEQAKKLSLKTHIATWAQWGILALVLVLLYGGLLMWAGYSLGTGQIQPLVLLLKMPVGIIGGSLCIGCGIFTGVLAARDFAEGHARWRRHMLTALAFLLPGGMICSSTMFWRPDLDFKVFFVFLPVRC